MASEQDPLKADFRNFLFMVWSYLSLPAPTPIQYDIAHYLQHGPRRCVIEAFRGVGKSWATSAFAVWLLYCDPQLRILVVSASKSRADDFSTFVLRLINEIECLHHLRPRDDQRSSKIAFDVGPSAPAHAPSIKSVGITGQLSGSRADIIIADDVEVPNNSETQVMRDKLSEAVKEFDAILKPGGRIIYLGTPQTEMSLYLKLPERGYSVRVWPARYPTPAYMKRMGDRIAPLIVEQLERNPSLVGRPTDTARFSDEDLMEREASYGRSGFALQFMLDASLSDVDRYPLKLADFIVTDLDPEKAPAELLWSQGRQEVISDLPLVGLDGDKFHLPGFISKDFMAYTGSVMFIDPSGRGKDETAYAVVNHLNGRLFVMDAGGFRAGYDTATLEGLARVAKLYKVKLILIEPNFGGGMFTQLMKPVLGRIYPCTVEDAEWSSAAKEKRIVDTLEPVLNQHRLVLNRSLVQKDYKSVEEYQGEEAPRYRLFYQMTRITRDRGALTRDDRIDALAGAVAYWAESMARDSDKAVRSAREKALDAELKGFHRNVLGHRKQAAGNTWFRLPGR